MGIQWITATLLCIVVATSVIVSGQKSKGKKLIVTTILNDPFLTLVNTNQTLTGNARFGGYIVDLLDAVSEKTGFKYELRLVPDNRYGEKVNGSWTGMISELVDKNADMAAAPLTISPTRTTAVDFSVPFMDTGPVLLMRKPSVRDRLSLKERVLRLLFPFGDMVWLTILIAYLVTGFFLYVVSYCNPYEWRKLAHDGLATVREAESFTCMNTYWFLLSTIMWQGFVRAPRSLGGRLITGFWWMFVVLTLITYTGALTNYLRVFREDIYFLTPISSFEDLAYSSMRVGAIESGATQEYLKNSKLAVYQKISERLRSSGDTFSTIDEAIDRVRSDRQFVFIMESTTAKYVSSRYCDLMYTEDTESPFFFALALQKGSRYMDAINSAILSLRVDGKLLVLQNRWLTEGNCEASPVISKYHRRSSSTEYFRQVDITTFSGILILLAVGIVAGCLVTAVEFCIFKIAEKSVEDEALDTRTAHVKKESDV